MQRNLNNERKRRIDKLSKVNCLKMASLSALLAVSVSALFSYSACYAITCGPNWCEITSTIDDQGTISPVTSTPTPATVSLSLSNDKMTSSAATPGSIATASTDVIVDVSNAESYTLNLAIKNSTNIVNGSTTIQAGDVTTDNTWGYKWDNATTYTAPSTSGTTLTNSTLVPLDSNGTVSFTKNLTFGAKFASNANPGTYHVEGIISLAATPKATALITLADLTQMQQLAPGHAPEACENTPYLDGKNYSAEYKLTDVRDNNEYTVRRFNDGTAKGKCWMTQNLKLSAFKDGNYYTHGRILNTTTSDISSDWTLPYTTSFNNDAAADSFLSGISDGNDTNAKAYYSWCAATAGTCASATSQGANAPSSICPKGWKLPVGYQSTKTNNDFWNLFRNMGLTISNDSLASTSGGYTNWGSGDLAKAQGSPYNFAYTGFMNTGSLGNATSDGHWWSRTAYSGTDAYGLYIGSGVVSPGTNNPFRRFGYAVRCVAQ